MANPKLVSELLPATLQTLAQPCKAKPETIERCLAYFDKHGWCLTGKETAKEKAELLHAKQVAAEWLAAWREGLEPYWLVLHGDAATGKTFLARLIERVIKNQGEAVYRQHNADGRDYTRSYGYAQCGAIYAAWADLVPYNDENKEVFSNAKRDWVKIVDDLMPKTGQPVEIDGELGIEPKRFEVTAAIDLLEARLRKWTVLTTNLSRQQFALFWDGRIASRLLRNGNTEVDLWNVRDFNLRK